MVSLLSELPRRRASGASIAGLAISVPPGLDDGATPAHWLAALFAAGSAVALAIVFVPHGMGMVDFVSWTNALVGLVIAAVLAVAGRRLPHWTLHPLLVAGVIVVSGAVASCHGSPLAIASSAFYIAFPMYAFRFFTRVAAAAHTVIVAIALGLVLGFTGDSAAPAEWIMIIAAAVTVGIFVSRVRTQLWKLATTDALTGLPNRQALNRQLAWQIARARRRNQALSVAMIDLDGFKGLNDHHGHAAGDAMLFGLAARWRTALRPHDTLARYGGDEFVLVLPGASLELARAVANRLPKDPNQPVSVGVVSLVASDTPATFLARADVAMYDVKHARLEH